MPQGEPSEVQKQWKEPQLQPTIPGDEIPGYTTYIYHLNRFRRPEEFVGYWKEEEKRNKKLAELMKSNDLDPTWDMESVIQILVDLNQKVLDLESRENTWRKDVQEAHQVKYELQTKLDNINKTIQNVQDEKMKESAAKMAALKQVMQYGGHANDCAYVEAAACGRIMRGSEEKVCDCGWWQTKQAIKEQIK